MLQPVSVGHKNLSDYTHIVGWPLIDEIRELSAPLAGLRVLHLSATAFGGGVSGLTTTAHSGPAVTREEMRRLYRAAGRGQSGRAP